MRLAVLVLACAACSAEPSLRVHIDAEQPPFERTVVAVYESPTATCEQIEYADLTEAQLAALRVAEQTITDAATEGDLDGLSRTDPKLVVVRGYAASGQLLEAGCAEHGLVVAADEITVTTHRIATVSVEPAAAAEPYQLVVLASDRDGVPIAGRGVAWRAYGPAGSHPVDPAHADDAGEGAWRPAAPACTDASGSVTIAPVLPDVVGGFAVAMRVAWANQLPTLFSGVTGTTFALTDLTIPAETLHPCAVSARQVGPTLVRRLVCIDRMLGATLAREYPVTVSASGVAELGAPTTTPLAGTPIGVFSVPVTGDAEQREVYAIDTSGQLTALAGATPPQPTTCTGCDGLVADALLAPACGERDAARFVLVVRQTGQSDRLKTIPPRGGLALDIGVMNPDLGGALTLHPNNAGCVTAIGSEGYESRQLTVFDVVAPAVSVTRGFYACSPTCKRVILPVPESAVAFTRTSPPYLIGATTDPTGLVLATWGLVPDPNDPTTDRLVERAERVPSAGPPNRLAVGTFDEDAGSDLIWDITQRGRGTAFELAYSKAAGSGRLQALSTAQAIATLDIFALPVTQDDADDDLIIVARKALPGTAGVVVIPSHATLPARTIPVSTCGS